MGKRLKDGHSLPDLVGQDGALPQRYAKEKYKEAAQKLFTLSSPKDPPVPSTIPADFSDGQSEAEETVSLDDPAGPLLESDTVSAQADIFDMPSISDGDEPEPTLRDIMAAMCNTPITSLTAEG